ncbi:lasso peptide biosynthesis B2 protein [Streptomyces sp. ISL-96]|uniref:lasso peptide biosynthesis B2 protein n=1 Tax=Streptomyces sp. ISL-96 TaxID=2819191 RepID=UPI001BE7B111|nr:lasso peptide biosynthesis B2 protein [Streptomyces sp. ISL-96]MBT2490125.1 lasso peptide biosynthesis B2 protein [Streptomyces sp. ISL-96]
MPLPQAVAHKPRAVPPARRVQALLVVGLARLLARRPPRRIRAVLGRVSSGARPASYGETEAAREAVVAVSLTCAAPEGCLPRSLATAMLCRLHGQWPTWCVGARRIPPFAAHAWVEAEGVPVGEGHPPDYFRAFFTVP